MLEFSRTEQIFISKNLNEFSIHPENRSPKMINVRKLSKKITKENHLQYHPIEVDNLLRIINGGHRWRAAQMLGLTCIWCKVISNEKEIAAILKDQRVSGKTWSKEDAICSLIEKGNKNYEKLRDFMKQENLSLSNALVALKYKGTSVKDFEEERFIFPNEESLQKIMEDRKVILSIIDYLCETGYFFTKQIIFYKALQQFGEIYSLKELRHRIEHSTFKFIKKCASAGEYVDCFKRNLFYKKHGNKV